MNYKDKKKLNSQDKEKITARYNKKLEEFKAKSLDELQKLYLKGGFSSTDRAAIEVATMHLLRQRGVEIAKEKELLDKSSDELDEFDANQREKEIVDGE